MQKLLGLLLFAFPLVAFSQAPSACSVKDSLEAELAGLQRDYAVVEKKFHAMNQLNNSLMLVRKEFRDSALIAEIERFEVNYYSKFREIQRKNTEYLLGIQTIKAELEVLKKKCPDPID
ncbi:MAG: hypothetical protein CMI36_13925 [Owenweeksia sp.]|nr:hypothetical protein [Owenweeksia sp.]MBG00089.1 hypothetical protein [Owenweeksia sp.]HBF21945.1 hypothetical protein [Cryomorphaceae bacterium]HCQ15341.1 hypothetical protein [Cryomorphaceae bacterium]|tara:strand:- start:3510 stop:3866 length:357 start_codon:yes stop_codon:yes gene_type:complete